MARILLATPAYGDMFYTPYVSSVIRLQRLLARDKHELIFAAISYADIVESRNFLLTHWYDKTDASHMLFVDADMGYDARLIADMIMLKKPLVGVVAPKRQVDLNRLAGLAARGEKAERAIARSHSFLVRPVARAGKPRIANGFMEVEGCGAGIMLIERRLVKTMLEKLPEVNDTGAKKTSPLAKNLDRLIRAFDPVTVKGARLSEDYSFCHRWRTGCGGEVWANISHPITHVGLHRYSGRYQDAMPRGPRIRLGPPAGEREAGRPATVAASGPTAASAAASVTVKEGGPRRPGTAAGGAGAPRPIIRRMTGALPRKPNGK
ncbi:MAG: hypothetical protein K2Y71_22645 [Xanthobacteraceae bacterium]|nr:hypothetical protein [Xanthobacteraceae bacterium]